MSCLRPVALHAAVYQLRSGASPVMKSSRRRPRAGDGPQNMHVVLIDNGRTKALADVKGRALMVHVGGDNYSDTPKPLGGGGGRLVCGVVK